MQLFFFYNAPATTVFYTLSLHDALPIYAGPLAGALHRLRLEAAPVADDLLQAVLALHVAGGAVLLDRRLPGDRKSTRLNSSHVAISYAIFCLKKKKKTTRTTPSLRSTRD